MVVVVVVVVAVAVAAVAVAVVLVLVLLLLLLLLLLFVLLLLFLFLFLFFFLLLLLVSRCNTSGTLPWYSLAAVTCTSTLRVWLKTHGLKRTSLSASLTSGLSSVCVDF